MRPLSTSPLLTGALMASALVAGVAWLQPAAADDPKPPLPPAVEPSQPDPADDPGPVTPVQIDPVQAEPPLIEVVFVVDTTGSMGGLIAGAKQKVWSIANEILSATPRPRLSMGLVAYRDRRDAYVTQVFQPTEDLDTVYANLMGFEAAGGGDGPEHVNMALAQALGLEPYELQACAPHRDCQHVAPAPGANRQRIQEPVIGWNPEASLKLVYLVGDAPAHRDYDQHVDYARLLPIARERQVTVNAVLCGGNAEARGQFSEIAQLGGGAFFEIAQSGGMQALATPHDDELRRLQRELEETRLYYGRADVRRQAEAARGAAMDMDGEEGAGRASALSKSGYAPAPAGARDLVSEPSDDAALAELEEDELPDALQGLSAQARQAKLAELAAKRKVLQDQIAQVVRERDGFLHEHQPKDGFDGRVLESLKEEAASAGLSWED